MLQGNRYKIIVHRINTNRYILRTDKIKSGFFSVLVILSQTPFTLIIHAKKQRSQRKVNKYFTVHAAATFANNMFFYRRN